MIERIIPEDGQINNTGKVQQPLKLRDPVFCTRLAKFHWDVDICVELRKEMEEQDHAETFENPISSQGNRSSAP